MTKQCTKCKGVKPVTAFSKDASRKDGLQHECKVCRRARKAAWRKAHLEKVAAYELAYYAARPGKKRANNLLCRYGLTPEQVDLMLANQHGICAICFTSINGTDERGRALANVDHDHSNGLLRDLLCVTCNREEGKALARGCTEGVYAAYAMKHRTRFSIQSSGIAA